MIKQIIGALVAGFLLMLWQTLSHTALNLHGSQETYTPKQAAILAMLTDSLGVEGQYFLPGVPPGTSLEAMEKAQKEMAGKPWAQISYHKQLDINMGANILRGLLTNFILGFVLVWLLGKIQQPSFTTLLLASLSIGFIAFCFHPYPNFIWFKTTAISIELLDSLVAFGLAGIWLGWWMTRKAK